MTDPLSMIGEFWWAGVPVALLMGVLLGASPSALPVLGMAVGVGATGELGSRGAGVKQAAAFGAGLAVVYGFVGFFVGRLDQVAEEIMRPYGGIAYLALGVMLAGLGVFMGLRPKQFCARCAVPARRNLTVMGAFAAGIPAGFVNCPACAGIVFGVAASAATLGPIYAGIVMLSLGVGHLLLLVALAWWVTKGWSPSPKMLLRLQRLGAIMLIALAVYFVRSALVVGLVPGPRLI